MLKRRVGRASGDRKNSAANAAASPASVARKAMPDVLENAAANNAMSTAPARISKGRRGISSAIDIVYFRDPEGGGVEEGLWISSDPDKNGHHAGHDERFLRSEIDKAPHCDRL